MSEIKQTKVWGVFDRKGLLVVANPYRPLAIRLAGQCCIPAHDYFHDLRKMWPRMKRHGCTCKRLIISEVRP